MPQREINAAADAPAPSSLFGEYLRGRDRGREGGVTNGGSANEGELFTSYIARVTGVCLYRSPAAASTDTTAGMQRAYERLAVVVGSG
jgi:hypothetical protein